MRQPVSSTDLAPRFISLKDLAVTTSMSVFYLLLSKILVGFKTEQWVLVILFNVLYYLSSASRKFIVGFSVFIVYWIIFDSMKAFPNYRFNTVHIQGLYDAEKYLFGITNGGEIITPNEYWILHSSQFLDIVTGFFYLCWVPVPLAFAIYMYFRNREQFLHFSFTFLVVNMVGFVIYYTYPAAPPWYVRQYGYVFHSFTPGNTAGLHRFDDFFGIKLFDSLYSKSSNVFAAMPSLHSAYPLIVLYYGLKNKLGWINVLFTVVVLGIFFSAVYTTHHYILDVIAGVFTAFTGIFIFNWLAEHKGPFRSLLQKMTAMIR